MTGVAGRLGTALWRIGYAAAILLILSVVIFDLVFSWFGPPASEVLAAIWFIYILPGNILLLIAGAYAAGYIGPFHLRRQSRAMTP